MDITLLSTMVVVLAFAVNITVQILKEFFPIPTKLLCLIVAVGMNLIALFGMSADGYVKISFVTVITAVVSSPVIAFISMYGFDTFKELWCRFKNGEDIDEG